MATASEIVRKLLDKNKELENKVRELEASNETLSQQFDARVEQLEDTIFTMLSSRIDDIRASAAAQGETELNEAEQDAISVTLGLQSVIAPVRFAQMYNINPTTGETFESEQERDEFLASPRVINQ